MKKDLYIELINEEIKLLIEKEERLWEEIKEITCTFEYHSFEDNVDLRKFEICSINENRQQIFAITRLISDLEDLKNKEV